MIIAVLLFGPRHNQDIPLFQEVIESDARLVELLETNDLGYLRPHLAKAGEFGKMATIDLYGHEFVFYVPGSMIQLFKKKLSRFDSNTRFYINRFPVRMQENFTEEIKQEFELHKALPMSMAAKSLAVGAEVDLEDIHKALAKSHKELVEKEIKFLAKYTRFDDNKQVAGWHKIFEASRREALGKIHNPANRDMFISTSGNRRFAKRYKKLAPHEQENVVRAVLQDRSITNEIATALVNNFSRWHWKGGF